MFTLLSKTKEERLRRYNKIYYLIKKGWGPVAMLSECIIPYEIHIIPDSGIGKTLFESYFIYKCYMKTHEDYIEINNITYTTDSRRFFFLKPEYNYMYLTMVIEKAISMAFIKEKSKLIISSKVSHTIEILLDHGFKNLSTYSGTDFQKGELLINHNRKKYVNN